MFTGIIETLGVVTGISRKEKNIDFNLASALASELKIDQSVAHNGVCLTVIAVKNDIHTITAVHETLQKTALGALQPGDAVNLERCVPANGRLDGHIVQGHVDCVAKCLSIEQQGGSWLISFAHPPEFITVAKGSVAVNGVSLTVVDSKEGYFSIALIPFTFEHTTFKNLKPGDEVNVEFDILGKYIEKILRQRGL